MVLSRIVPLCLVAACGQSLFDNNGTPDAAQGSGDGAIVSSCPAACLADAGRDFDGTPGGAGNRWGYFDDVRTRKWNAMTAMAGGFVGADPANKIASCAANPGAPACGALPGALLVSSAGATSGADPSIAFTATSKQVVSFSISIFVPSGAPNQVVRLYRNSREDVLFTGTATAGTALGHSITVDALPGDRFLVALAPMAMGAADVGVQFYASAPGIVFPSQCQLAVPFSVAGGFVVDDVCVAHKLTYWNDMSSTMTAPTLAAGPFTELGQAADILPDRYYESNVVLDKSGDTTIQFWVRHDAPVPFYGAHVLSDIDLNSTGGIDFDIYDNGNGGLSLDVTTCTDAGNPLQFAMSTASYPSDMNWHFIRVTHTGGNVTTCLDGVKKATFALPAGKLNSTFHPYVGKNVIWLPVGAFFDGGMDDLRVLSTALPCE